MGLVLELSLSDLQNDTITTASKEELFQWIDDMKKTLSEIETSDKVSILGMFKLVVKNDLPISNNK